MQYILFVFKYTQQFNSRLNSEWSLLAFYAQLDQKLYTLLKDSCVALPKDLVEYK